MTERSTKAFVAFAAVVLLASAVVPMLVAARPAREIPAPTVKKDLSGTDAPGWSSVPAAEIPLSAAPSGLPNAKSVSTRSVDVQAARSDGQVFVRLQWHDGEASLPTQDPRSFVDAAAVEMPVNATTQPAIAMGSPTNRVNVWYWNAGNETEELLAGGPGSTTRMLNTSVETWAEHTGSGENATWTVVFARQASSSVDNQTAITRKHDLDVAFAVWNGSNAERSGRKAVSQWYYFPFGPGPGGAPFETLLWAIAGIAVVAVVVLTAQGIRRTRVEGGA